MLCAFHIFDIKTFLINNKEVQLKSLEYFSRGYKFVENSVEKQKDSLDWPFALIHALMHALVYIMVAAVMTS